MLSRTGARGIFCAWYRFKMDLRRSLAPALVALAFFACRENDSHSSFAEKAQAVANALSDPVVTGSLHSVGGELGTWDLALTRCQSGEYNGFYGVDFYDASSDNMRLRYVHDEAVGDVVKVAIPSKEHRALVFDRDAKCSVLEGSVEKLNVTTWTSKGKIRHLSGRVKLDCVHSNGAGHVTGEATFSHCH